MNFQNQEAEESPYMAMQPNAQLCDNDSVMAKIARFIDARHIPIDTFWQSDRNCASAADIITFCKSCGLNLPEYDFINLKS